MLSSGINAVLKLARIAEKKTITCVREEAFCIYLFVIQSPTVYRKIFAPALFYPFFPYCQLATFRLGEFKTCFQKHSLL